MNEKLRLLYELQKIDTAIAAAQKARASLNNGATMKQQLEAVREAFQEAEELYKNTVRELRDCELELKGVESKNKLYNDRLYAGKITNPKELSSIEQEIEMLKRQKDKLEERILELMDLVEERKMEMLRAQESLQNLDKEYEAFIASQRKKSAMLAAEIKQLTAMREEILPKIDPALLSKYEALSARLGGIGISKVEQGTCSACRTQLLKNTISALSNTDEIQTCENCSRILYLEK